MTSESDQGQQKLAMRRRVTALRHDLDDHAGRSLTVCCRVLEMPEYREASCVMLYMAMPDELRTELLLGELIGSGRTVVIPYCDDRQLRLFRFESLDDLEPSAYKILEPKPELRASEERYLSPDQLDVILVPGVAFDRQGGRLGHGVAYFDRLLNDPACRATTIGLAYDCQLVEQIPMEAHDVRMQWIVTESSVFSELNA